MLSLRAHQVTKLLNFVCSYPVSRLASDIRPLSATFRAAISSPAPLYAPRTLRSHHRRSGMLSRGMAATGRFFGDSRRKSRRRRGSGEVEGTLVTGDGAWRGEEGGEAAAGATSAAKLEGEEETREREGLRVVPRHVAFVMDGNGRW